jgi:biopolymer transport protein ExbD/biopolymer transport protein TolR
VAFTNLEGKTQTALSEINMIPFIDVVLVLLIIFMVTAPVIQSGIDVNVPKTTYVRELSQEKIMVTIDAKQTVYLQNQAVNLNELGDKIREKMPDPTRQSIYLLSDESVPFGVFATVMDRLKAVGIDNISIVTQPLDKKKK